MNKFCIILVLLVIAGCAPPKYIAYHSSAEVPLLSDLTISNMTYISPSRAAGAGRESRSFSSPSRASGAIQEFGLFSAIDDNKTYYLLFAPRLPMGGGGGNPYKRYNIALAVPVVPDKVKELLAAVRIAIQVSDSLYTKKDARFIEFMIAPEQEVKPLSPYVVQWNPTLKFVYQTSNSKAVSKLFFGEGFFRQVVDLKERRDLLDLESIIVLGIEDLKAKGCTEF